ncbi:Mobile element protein [Streptococcus oralis]|uniref:Mobile element protein n=1 Tax=Streptococcus oralis TaxID=1303 RepID=A0A139PGE2_STROR|nr:Mobile element protein [Streptococcus oralis]
MIREFFSSIWSDGFFRQGLQHLCHSLYDKFAFLGGYLLNLKKTRIAVD